MPRTEEATTMTIIVTKADARTKDVEEIEIIEIIEETIEASSRDIKRKTHKVETRAATKAMATTERVVAETIVEVKPKIGAKNLKKSQ